MNEKPDDGQLRSLALRAARRLLARESAGEELLRAREALATRSELLEHELADFFENAGVGLHWVGADGTILRANRAELELLGYAREEYVGHHIAEFHVDREVIDDVMRRLAAGEIVREREARMRCKDGSVRHVLLDSSVRWEGGRFVHTRCVTRDVTDRKRAEEAQARLAAIVESSQDAIVSKTLDSRVRSWNAGAEELFGWRAEEMIGEPITRIIPPERQDEERMILERLRRGERVEHYETVRVRKDGRRIDVSLTISPIRDGAGRIVGASKIARDVTARRRAEQRLAAHTEVTRALAESSGLEDAVPRILRALCEHLDWQLGALWRVDGQGGLLRCVEVHHRPDASLPGFEAASRGRTLARGAGLPGRAWVRGEPVFVPDVASDPELPRAAAAAAADIHAALAFPIALRGELLGVVELFSREVRPPDPDLLRLVSAIGSQVAQLIERRRAEAALRESEQRFRVMADAVPSIIWTAGPDGAVTYANDRFFEYTGLDPALGGRGWPERVLHPDDRGRCVAAWEAALRGGLPYEVEARSRRRDGVYRWFATRAVPLRDPEGRIVQWVGTTHDVDDRKRAERTTRFLADASAALAALSDPETTLRQVATLAVPEFADWCAVDVAEPDGSVRRLAVAHADPAKVELVRELERRYPSRPSERHGVRQVLRTGAPEWASAIPDELLVSSTQDAEHLRIVRELGLRSYVCVPLRSRERVLGAITFVTAESGRAYDASDVRAAEDLASRAVIALENASLLATLREADRRKDEFLAMLAHELRNPLAPVRSATRILRERGPGTPDLRWVTDVIDRQVHQMSRLVDDLLDVSRITRGKIELRRERVELAAVVESAVEASRPLLEQRGHALEVAVPRGPIPLDADPARLAQVFSNLLNNAAKYTHPGGHVRLAVEPGGDHVLVRVADDGIGIPREALARVFDMFTQLGCAPHHADGGLGIGLTLVRRLVELHGGEIEARSDGPGEGSEFVVRLPRAAEPERVGERAADAATRATPPRRVLVVDDNRDAADTLGTLLRMAGNEVEVVHDGAEAVAAAAAFRPEVVLLDLGLPKLGGHDVARRIRAQEGGASVLLVALTGWGQEEDRRRSQEAGFDHHLTKPVEFDAVLRLLAGTAPGEPEGGAGAARG